AYLERYGEPRTPEALREHRCLAYAIPGSGCYREWEFARGGRKYAVGVSGPLNINGGEALVDAAIADLGIVTVASFIAAEAIATGKLRLILRDDRAEGPAVSVTYLPARPLPARVRAFIDFLREVIPPQPPWERMLWTRDLGPLAPASSAHQPITPELRPLRPDTAVNETATAYIQPPTL